VLHVAIYRGFPETEALTALTIGLSHTHPSGGAHKELVLSMRDSDEAWALACGFTAYQLRESCAFACGETINFREKIAGSSSMSAFVVLHPIYMSIQDSVVDLGFREVHIMQLVPLYESERAWLAGGGDVKALLNAYPPSAFMDPQRKSFQQ